MNTLHLIFKPHLYCDGGLWTLADHISQEIALKHFSGGSVAIGYHRLDEIIYVAGLHGWKVTTEGDPAEPEQPEPSSVKMICGVPLQAGDWAVECRNPGHFLRVHPDEVGKIANDPRYSFFRENAGSDAPALCGAVYPPVPDSEGCRKSCQYARETTEWPHHSRVCPEGECEFAIRENLQFDNPQ